jgi:hypothetical protein
MKAGTLKPRGDEAARHLHSLTRRSGLTSFSNSEERAGAEKISGVFVSCLSRIEKLAFVQILKLEARNPCLIQ